MKTQPLFFILFFCSLLATGQYETPKETKDNFLISVSGGWHPNIFQLSGTHEAAFNLQSDVLFRSRYSLGLGYTYDRFHGSNYFFSTRIRPGNLRQNLNIRFLYYFHEPVKIFSVYVGCSAGISHWQIKADEEELFPTTQFLFGMRLKIYKGIFWLNEFGIGPPYLYQTSLGIRF